MSTNDGGPAFPQQNGVGSDGTFHMQTAGGMSLRDYFAAKAMASLIGKWGNLHTKEDFDCASDRVGVLAYQIADVMLNEREKAKP